MVDIQQSYHLCCFGSFSCCITTPFKDYSKVQCNFYASIELNNTVCLAVVWVFLVSEEWLFIPSLLDP